MRTFTTPGVASATATRLNTNMFFGAFTKAKPDTRLAKKQELLDNLKGLGRGADANEEDRKRIDQLAGQLERQNPTKNVLGPELSAKWKLIYTTSDSINATKRPPFLRPAEVFQTIDVDTLSARNQETFPFFNAVEAKLEPINSKKVNVLFQTFYILGLIPVKAPPSARGELEITYLDADMRISRGNRGNLFILTRAGKK